MTEPLIYYHFEGKEALYTIIVNSSFERFFSILDSFEYETGKQFEKIEKLISAHFQIVEEMPYETCCAINTCPAKLRDPDHVCGENVKNWRDRIKAYLSDCLTKGIESGEFVEVPVHETAIMLIAMLNGLIRQQIHKMDNFDGVKGSTVEFCRRSLKKH